MATDDGDQGYRDALRDIVGDLSRQLGQVREQMRTDVTEALARYREDNYRAIMAIQTRLVQAESREESDRLNRAQRQDVLDKRLDTQDARLVEIVQNQAEGARHREATARTFRMVVYLSLGSVLLSILAVGMGVGLLVMFLRL